MTTEDELEQQLWEYVYGLLDAEEARALEVRITSEHDVARAYAEVRQRADLLGRAARLETAPLKLRTGAVASPAATPRAERRPASLRMATWLAASAALVLVTLSLYGGSMAFRLRDETALVQEERKLAAEFPRLTVAGPAVAQRDAHNLYCVCVENLNGQPAQSEVRYALTDRTGQVLQERTLAVDDQGQARLTLLGEELPADGRLEVWAKTGAKQSSVALDVTCVEPQEVTFLQLDQTTYVPGDTLRFRAVTVAPFSGKINENAAVNVRLLSQEGEALSDLSAQQDLERGTHFGALLLDTALPQGDYALVAQGGPAADPTVSSFQVMRGMSTDEYAEDLVEQLTPAAIQFYPEGGQLIPQVENRVYFFAHNGRGFPVDLQAKIVDSNRNSFADVSTEFAGRGYFMLRPDARERYELVAPQADAIAPLPEASENARVTLTAERSVLSAGEPLRVQVTSLDPEAQLLVSASAFGATMGQELVRFDSPQPDNAPLQTAVTVPLAEEAAGVIDVTLYDYRQTPPKPLASRLVCRPPARYWKVQATEQEVSEQDFTACWSIQVKDEAGAKAPATLGISAVAIATSEADDPLVPLSLLAYVPPHELGLSPEKLDLFLGTTARTSLLGFAPQPTAKSTLVSTTTESHAPPALVDNLKEVETQYRAAIVAWRDAQQDRLHRLAQMILLGSMVVLIALALLAMLRATGSPGVWIPAAACSLATLMLSTVWLGARIDRPIEVAARPLKTYAGPPVAIDALHADDVDVDGTSDPSQYRMFGAMKQPMGGHGAIAGAPGNLSLGRDDFLRFDGNAAASLPPYLLNWRFALEDRWSTSLAAKHRSSQTDGFGAYGAAMTPEHAPEAYALGAMPTPANKRSYRNLVESLDWTDQVADIDSKRTVKTLYWNPVLKTDAEGRAEIRFSLPQRETRYRLTIFAHGNRRFGTLMRTSGK